MASKKKPTAAQLAARAKFTAMVKAKAAARKKAGSKSIARPKKAGKKIGNPNKKYYIEYFYKGLEHREYFNEIPERAFTKGKYVWVSAKNNIGYPLMHTMTDLPVRTDGKQSKTLDELLSGTHKDTKSHNVNVRVVSGLHKVVRNKNKTAVLYSRLSGLFDTSIISDIDQLKKEYFKLAKKYHPDAGGTKEQFQMLGLEYENLLKKLLSGSKLTSEQQNNEIILDEALRKAIDAIIGLPNISIELVGKWIWISGNTYPLRNELKAAGFMFAPKKKMWYYKGTESSGRGDLSIEEIKMKYGSTKIMPKDGSKYLSGFGKITRAQRAKFKANLVRATKAINKRAI